MAGREAEKDADMDLKPVSRQNPLKA